MPLKLVKWRVLLESLRPYYHHLDLDGGILENSTPRVAGGGPAKGGELMG